MQQQANSPAHPMLRRELEAIRDHVRTIVPGGRDPEVSYMGKRDALRGLDRLIGDRR